MINELIHLRAEADEVAPIGPNGPLPVIRVTAPTPMGSTVSLHKSTQQDPERNRSIPLFFINYIINSVSNIVINMFDGGIFVSGQYASLCLDARSLSNRFVSYSYFVSILLNMIYYLQNVLK